MPALAHQRCFHHSVREAVARCPECRHFYCRECITEHEDRVICTACLRRLTTREIVARRGFPWLWPALQFTLGAVCLWFVFYFLGGLLLSIPSQYHEGTVWIDEWWKGK
jgi:hypothetical protein